MMSRKKYLFQYLALSLGVETARSDLFDFFIAFLFPFFPLVLVLGEDRLGDDEAAVFAMGGKENLSLSFFAAPEGVGGVTVTWGESTHTA